MSTTTQSSPAGTRWPVILPILALALWFGAMGWGTDAAFRKFERHTSASPPQIDASEAWRQARFFVDPDSYLWLSYARDLRENKSLRMRRTLADNAPYGREMHWSHLPVWSLMAISTGLEKTGVPPPVALELAGRILMPLTGFLAFSALFLFLRRRIGLGPAALCALTPATLLFWNFHPLRPDHDAFQLMFAFFCGLFLLFSGFGWTSATAEDKPASRYFVWSGLCGGLALWIGSTVFLFSLAAFTLASAWVLLGTPADQKWRMRPECWRRWAWAGAGTSLLFYALEYAPEPLALRLEVNHPLYALSWLGIGECLYLFARWKHVDSRLSPLRLLHAATALAAAAALPLLILFGPESAYLPRTILMLRLHASHIHEFQTIRAFAIQNHANIGLLLLRLLGPGVIFTGMAVWLRRKSRLDFIANLRSSFALPVFLLFSMLLCWQIRWRPYAVMSSLLLAIALLAAFPPAWRRPARLIAALLGLQCAAGLWINLLPFNSLWKVEHIEPRYLTALQTRNLMVNMRETTLDPIRLMAPSEMAPAATYFGVGDAIASLYWENLPGLQAGAEFFGAPLPGKQARQIADERQITHVIMNEGAQDALTFYHLQTGRDDQLGASQTVGGALTGIGTKIPPWLRFDETLNQAVNPPLYTFVPAIGQWAPSRMPTRIYVVDLKPTEDSRL